MAATQYIQVKNVACRFEDSDDTIFDNISFTLSDGLQCLVGQNGSGKSLLAAIVAGKMAPTEGEVIRSGKVGYLSQGIELQPQSVAALLGVDTLQAAWQRIQNGECSEQDFALMDGRWDFEQQLQQALDAFGFTSDVLSQSIDEFSGGEQTRLRLVQLTLAQCDCLVLDEPSNHLDQPGRQQLLAWLKQQPCVLLVTHDRQLLAHAEAIYELEQGCLYRTKGNWEAYQLSRQQRLQTLSNQEQDASKALQTAKRKQKELNERQAKQNKKGASSRKNANQSKMILDKAKETSEQTQGIKAKQAQQAIHKNAQTLSDIQAQKARISPLHFQVAQPRVTSGVVAQLNDVILPYAATEPVQLQLQAGEKLAITGANGTGKSTLLKVMAGEIAPCKGHVKLTRFTRYLDQHFSLLQREKTALDNFQHLCPGFTQTEYRTRLAQIRLRREKALYPIAHLSGGERLKVALACLFFGEFAPDLLLLDEPDNHLDLESKQLLEQTLNAYGGALIVVSHDPVFLQGCGIEQTRRIEQAKSVS